MPIYTVRSAVGTVSHWKVRLFAACLVHRHQAFRYASMLAFAGIGMMICLVSSASTPLHVTVCVFYVLFHALAVSVTVLAVDLIAST